MKQYEALTNRVPDLKQFIKELHNKNIYVIARISVFQDSFLAETRPELAIKTKSGGVWKDRKGVSWLDPVSKEVWDYTAEIARETEKAGFDELNFDYIRFPSDGNMENTSYSYWDEKTPKEIALKNFFAFLRENLAGLNIPLSANLFGLTLWRMDDLNIGQTLETAAPYFDYIAPMIYPSHFPPQFNGFKNPAAHPYEIIFEGMKKGSERLIRATSSPLKLRPWIQDFDLGADYDASMIKKQKKAIYDAGLTSWMTWNAANKYTEGGYE